MIFYFTGTGNSQWVANELGSQLQTEIFSISDIIKKKEAIPPLEEEEKLLFVFPIHSWGPPSFVTTFIENLSVQGYKSQPVFVVCTCGDDCGYTQDMIAKTIRNKKWNFAGCYSVTMPNNYILFPGFDVDNEQVTQKKLSEAAQSIQQIGKAIAEDSALDLYTTGKFPYVKSRIIQPMFVKHVLGKNSFYSTAACISCGLCATVCPTETIYMDKRKPHWKDSCIQCLACIHRCPERAIEYGKITLKKGRYHHPEVK